MDIEQLYRDFNIDYVTEGHRHAHPGWIHTHCPFCAGSRDYHLGFDTNDEKFMCWRCGWHAPQITISSVLNVNMYEARSLLKKYGGRYAKAKELRRKIKRKGFRLPKNSEALKTNHKQYLLNRGFDPKYLIKTFGLLGTSFNAPLSTGVGSARKLLNYKHRIILPFTWDSKIVTFDARDITNRAQNKYQACPADREDIPHKNILYGKQDKWGDTLIAVEGPTDVWRMGVHSGATSGIKYTPAQVRVLAKNFKRVPVLFDDEPQAIAQANKLVSDLKFRGLDSFRVDIKGDPGGLSQEEANYLVKQLI